MATKPTYLMCQLYYIRVCIWTPILLLQRYNRRVKRFTYRNLFIFSWRKIVNLFIYRFQLYTIHRYYKFVLV
jgi:hypothetical protein